MARAQLCVRNAHLAASARILVGFQRQRLPCRERADRVSADRAAHATCPGKFNSHAPLAVACKSTSRRCHCGNTLLDRLCSHPFLSTLAIRPGLPTCRAPLTRLWGDGWRVGGVGGKRGEGKGHKEGAKEKSILVFLEEREGRGCSTRRGGSGSCRHWRPRSFRIPRCVELCECARACMFQCARARVESVTAGTSRWLTSLQPAGIPSTRVHPGGSTAPATG